MDSSIFFSRLNWRIKHIVATISYQTYLIINGHLLNPLWRTRTVRRYKRSEITAKAVKMFYRLYSKEIKDIKIPVQSLSEEPERAFSIWFQGEDNAPNSVKACFRSMRKHLKQELIVIDEESLSDWITLPDFIIRKWKCGIIGNAHFSDICRLQLLYQHGGLWFDATDFVTAPVPKEIMDIDFFVFMGGRRVLSWYGFIQNCFIRARKGNELVGIWRDAILRYWEKENKIITYLGHQILFEYVIETNERAAELFSKMPKIDQDPTHVLWYGHKDDSFEISKYEEYSSPIFFQKTDFKDKSARNPICGSMAHHMLVLDCYN